MVKKWKQPRSLSADGQINKMWHSTVMEPYTIVWNLVNIVPVTKHGIWYDSIFIKYLQQTNL
jgi:hypothetical protein